MVMVDVEPVAQQLLWTLDRAAPLSSEPKRLQSARPSFLSLFILLGDLFVRQRRQHLQPCSNLLPEDQAPPHPLLVLSRVHLGRCSNVTNNRHHKDISKKVLASTYSTACVRTLLLVQSVPAFQRRLVLLQHGLDLPLRDLALRRQQRLQQQ